jgi:hypothetical protein
MDYSLNSWFPQDGISFSAWKEWRESVLHPDKLLEPEETEWVTYYVGVDLGMRRDPSTVAVVELRENARLNASTMSSISSGSHCARSIQTSQQLWPKSIRN